jgi:hypothetical protein
VIAFVAVMNETIRPYLASRGHTAEEVDRMHGAWCKSLQLQMALWLEPYRQDAGRTDDSSTDTVATDDQSRT